MQKIQAILIVVLCTLFTVFVNGQEDSGLWRTYNNPPPGVTFEDLQNSFNAYWKDRAYEKGKGYKQFKRWEAEMKPRIYPSGDMTLPTNNYKNYLRWRGEYKKRANTNKAVGPLWTELGPKQRVTGFDSGNGRVNMLRVDPNDPTILYVGAADGGLWKSTNNGVSWSSSTDLLSAIGVADLAIDPNNSDIMYLATGDVEGDCRSIGVLKSTDGGASWNTTGLIWSSADNKLITKMLMDPDDADKMLISTNQGVFRTTDGWNTWTQATPLIHFQDLEFKPGDTDVVYASGTKFYKSTDNGVTFSQVTSGLPSSSSVVRMVIAVSEDDPTVVYAFCGSLANSGYLGLYRSTNSGASFTTRSTSPNVLGFEEDGLDTGGQAFYDMALTVSPTDVDFVTVGGINQWQSDDGGASWYIISHWIGAGGNPYVHADVHEITHSATTPTTMYTCCDGGIYRSTDEGATWNDISNNLAISQINTIGISTLTADRMFCGLQDIGTIETDDVTVWDLAKGGGGDGEDCFIDRTDDDYIVVTGTNGSHELSTDGGLTFNDITSGIPSGDGNAEFFSAIRQHPIWTDTYLAGGRTDFYRTDDNGSSWYALGNPFGSDPITEFIVAPGDTSVIYATSSFEIARSDDSGDTWSDITGSLPVGTAKISKIAVSDSDEDKVWVTFSGYDQDAKVFKSVDGGSSWTNISSGLPNIPINTIVYENGTSTDNIYIGADIGVYFINNVQNSWIPHANGLANAKVKDLRIYYAASPSKLRAATYGRGAWEVDVVTQPCNITITETCSFGPCLFISGLYQAQGDINYSGDFSVENNVNVILSSGTSTSLTNGFNVALGSRFEINTDGCTP